MLIAGNNSLTIEHAFSNCTEGMSDWVNQFEAYLGVETLEGGRRVRRKANVQKRIFSNVFRRESCISGKPYRYFFEQGTKERRDGLKCFSHRLPGLVALLKILTQSEYIHVNKYDRPHQRTYDSNLGSASPFLLSASRLNPEMMVLR